MNPFGIRWSCRGSSLSFNAKGNGSMMFSKFWLQEIHGLLCSNWIDMYMKDSWFRTSMAIAFPPEILPCGSILHLDLALLAAWHMLMLLSEIFVEWKTCKCNFVFTNMRAK